MHTVKHPDAPGEVGNSAISTNIGADRLLHKFGFEVCRYFFDMKRSLDLAVPQVQLADGVRLVPFDYPAGMAADEGATIRARRHGVCSGRSCG